MIVYPNDGNFDDEQMMELFSYSKSYNGDIFVKLYFQFNVIDVHIARYKNDLIVSNTEYEDCTDMEYYPIGNRDDFDKIEIYAYFTRDVKLGFEFAMNCYNHNFGYKEICHYGYVDEIKNEFKLGTFYKYENGWKFFPFV